MYQRAAAPSKVKITESMLLSMTKGVLSTAELEKCFIRSANLIFTNSEIWIQALNQWPEIG